MSTRGLNIQGGLALAAAALAGYGAYAQPEPGVASTLFVASSLLFIMAGLGRFDRAAALKREQRALAL